MGTASLQTMDTNFCVALRLLLKAYDELFDAGGGGGFEVNRDRTPKTMRKPAILATRVEKGLGLGQIARFRA